MPRRIRQFVRTSTRIVFVAVAGIAYLAAAIGFPLPSHVKDRSIPFPCQDRACGCRTAEQCWQDCCCFTREEHVAFARSHDLELPPGYEAGGGWNDRPQRQAEPKSCCAASSCCANHGATAQNFEEPKPSCCAQPTSLASSPTSPSSTAWVIGEQLLKCRGLTLSWVQAGTILPPPLPQTLSRARDGALVSVHFDDDPLVLPLCPPVPPPRG
jgi:hypothetical protein